MPNKLIDAEAAKAALLSIDHIGDHLKRDLLAALDALPDANEQAIHAERIPVPPHLADAQRVVIRNALAAQPQEGE